MENQKMKKKLSSLEQEYDRLEHVTDLDEMLDLQVVDDTFNTCVCLFLVVHFLN